MDLPPFIEAAIQKLDLELQQKLQPCFGQWGGSPKVPPHPDHAYVLERASHFMSALMGQGYCEGFPGQGEPTSLTFG